MFKKVFIAVVSSIALSLTAVNPAFAASAPSAPRTLAAPAALVTSSTVNLTWVAPSSNGGKAITDYTVQYKLSTAASWTTFVDGVKTTTGAKVTGLTRATGYSFRVAAKNSIGTGAYTATVVATTLAVAPSSPVVSVVRSSVSSSSRNNGIATLSWTAPNNGGSAITDYIVKYRVKYDSSWATFNDGVKASTGAVVTGLYPYANYEFQVAAVNAKGSSGFSALVAASYNVVSTEFGSNLVNTTVLYGSCQPYILLPMRGSGEAFLDSQKGAGTLLKAVYDSLNVQPKFAGKISVSVPNSTQYSAPMVSFDDRFLSSQTFGGGVALAESVKATAAVCPMSKLILAGYSQGSYTVDYAYSSLDSSYTSKIVATVRVADPNLTNSGVLSLASLKCTGKALPIGTTSTAINLLNILMAQSTTDGTKGCSYLASNPVKPALVGATNGHWDNSNDAVSHFVSLPLIWASWVISHGSYVSNGTPAKIALWAQNNTSII